MEKRFQWRWVCIYSLGLLCINICNGDDYFNEFAVQCTEGQETVDELVKTHGFKLERKLGDIGVFILSHPTVHSRSKRSADSLLNKLQNHPQVIHAQQEQELIRVKRSIVYDKQEELPLRDISDNSIYHRVDGARLQLKDEIPTGNVVDYNDPLFQDQWYINNIGQSGGVKDVDLNVMVAWKQGYTGTGIVISILDDGVDHTHKDLITNYDPDASTDLNGHTNDPMPNVTTHANAHGTRCAGSAAAFANNNVCGVGIAHTAKIGGVKILDGKVTDSLEAAALNFNIQHIDIFSASWGPMDNGKTMQAPKHYTKAALRKGVTEGRKGKGNIYVWATGNGGANGDDCSADGYVSSIETLSIGSITDKGRRPFFMENCTSTIAVVPSGGEEVKGEEARHGIVKLKVITTDIKNGCIENFQGTSSAAPLGAGCIALLLQANPELTWRDVQHIVIQSSKIPSVDTSWIINGAGLHVSHKFGYGVMDCGKMVELAQHWNNVPKQHTCSYNRSDSNIKINSRSSTETQIFVDGCKDTDSEIDRLEHVQIHIKLTHSRRGDIQIFLTSPAGTRSEMLSPRPHDDFNGEWEFTFMSVHTWGEHPNGLWKLEINDNPTSLDRTTNEGYLSSWSLILYGFSGSRVDRMLNYNTRQQKAIVPKEPDVISIMDEEHLISKRISIEPNHESHPSIKKSEGKTDHSDVASDIIDLLSNGNDVLKRGKVSEGWYKNLEKLVLEEERQLDKEEEIERKKVEDEKKKEIETKREFKVEKSDTELLIDLLTKLTEK